MNFFRILKIESLKKEERILKKFPEILRVTKKIIGKTFQALQTGNNMTLRDIKVKKRKVV